MQNRMKYLARVVLAALPLGLAFLPDTSHSGLTRERQSVVKIYVTVQQEDFQQPWQSRPPASGSGSGFIIKGKRIMTNAHVVSDARFIEVQREGEARKVPATVAFIGHDCDIAVLQVKDESFFDHAAPVTFGTTLPVLNDSVLVLGYPMGGDRLSLTKGVVSRIDYSLYTHSTVDSHLAMQVDAAINPGNSGGPLIDEAGYVRGVTTMILQNTQGIGFAIPIEKVFEEFGTTLN
jgi:S1-C subfamily serine protease